MSGTKPTVRIGDTLSRGGMGVVSRGWQIGLEREVAVKTVPPGEHERTLGPYLAREARIGSQLDHPNIVPIHALEVSEGGRPVMVMRLLEGRPWSEWMPPARTWDTHLRVLVQLCYALEFAHSRGVIHRDIKPDNVIVGDFGSVTLIDFGVAVRMADTQSGASLCGTPEYISPEQASGRPQAETTDVYLLGGCLYRVLSGRPPHRAATSEAALIHALTMDGVADEGLGPPELVAIAHRALRLEPADRYQSVAQMREAIEAVQAHASSQRAAEAGLAALADLGIAATNADDPVAAHRLYGTAVGAFDAALAEWPANPAARQGLDAANAILAGFEAHRGDPAVARALLAEQPAPSGELLAQIERAEIARSERRVAQEQLDADQRDRRYRGTNWGRSAAVLGNGVLTTAILVGWGLLDASGWLAFTHLRATGLLTVGALLNGATVRWAAAVLLDTDAFRRGMYLLVAAHLLLAVLHGASHILDIPTDITVFVDLGVSWSAAFVCARVVTPLLWGSVVIVPLGALLLASHVVHPLVAAGICYAANNLWIAWALRPLPNHGDSPPGS